MQLCQIRVVLLSKFSQFVRFALSVSVWTWVEDVGLTKLFWGWTHGLHSVPSLKQLHVHVMTLDLNSPCMKMLGCSKVAGKNKHTMALWHASTVSLFWWALLARNAKHFRRSVGFTLKLPFCCPTNTGVDRFAGLASAHSLNFFFRVYLPSSNSTAWKGYISTFELSKQGVRLVSPGVNSLIIIQVRGATKHFDWEVPSSVVLPFLDPVRISNLGSFLPPFLAPWPDWVFIVTHWNACRHSWTGNQGFSWRSHSDASRWCLEQQAEKLDKDPGCHRCLLSNLGPQKSWKRTWRSGVCVAIAEPQANSNMTHMTLAVFSDYVLSAFKTRLWCRLWPWLCRVEKASEGPWRDVVIQRCFLRWRNPGRFI